MSRYVHLNPVRVRALGLGKAEQKALKAGASAAPQAEMVKERIRLLRANQGGAYRAYVGLTPKPAWLTCEVILAMLGGKQAEREKNYRGYVEAAVRDGLPPKPDPGGALMLADHLGVEPRNCIYLGDMAVDMETAAGAGMCPVGALWGFEPSADTLAAAGARMLVRHPSDLGVWFGG